MIAGVSSLADAHAAANELVLDALFPRRAGGARPTDVRSLRLLAAAAVRISSGAAGTLAGKGAGLVVADRALGAGVDRALVDVPAATLHSWLPCVTTSTEAGCDVVRQHAVGVWPA